MTRYTLPDLRYDYRALEPHISGETMRLHHDQHHRGYVEGANQAIERLLEARRRDDFEQIASIEQKMAFNVSGHVLHSIFWQNLSPDGGGQPSGGLMQAIARDFSRFDLFKEQLIQTAMTIMGSGWAALVWDPVTRRLGTTQIHDHQSQITQGGIPLLVIDAWEHAYYLQYRADKQAYLEAVWNVFAWDDVTARLGLAMKVDLGLAHAAAGVTGT